MSIPADRFHQAPPFDQGRLGREVEDALNTLSGLARRVGRGDEEDERRRAHHLARFSAIQLSRLADRARDVGELCPAVEEELMVAESLVASLSAKALEWSVEAGERPFPGAEHAWTTLVPRASRSEYVQSVMRLAISMSRRFPGDTAGRWSEMASTAASAGNGASPGDP